MRHRNDGDLGQPRDHLKTGLHGHQLAGARNMPLGKNQHQLPCLKRFHRGADSLERTSVTDAKGPADFEAPVEKRTPPQTLVADEADRPRARDLQRNDVNVGKVIGDE